MGKSFRLRAGKVTVRSTNVLKWSATLNYFLEKHLYGDVYCCVVWLGNSVSSVYNRQTVLDRTDNTTKRNPEWVARERFYYQCARNIYLDMEMVKGITS